MDKLKKYWLHLVVGAFVLLLIFAFSSLFESVARIAGYVPEEVRSGGSARRTRSTTSPEFGHTGLPRPRSSVALTRLRRSLDQRSAELKRVRQERDELQDLYAKALEAIQAAAEADPLTEPPRAIATKRPDAKQPKVEQLRAELVRRQEEIEKLQRLLSAVDPEEIITLRGEKSALEEQMSALQTLASEAAFLAGREAVPTLVESLGDRRPYVQRMAATLLGAIGPEARDAISALNEALATNDPELRAAIRRALREISRD